MSMDWMQRTIHLKPRSRGFHLVTPEVLGQLPELSEYRVGRCTFSSSTRRRPSR